MESTGKTVEIRRDTLPRRLADGEPGAPGDMVRSFYPELYAYARAMLHDRHVAEDVVHDSFVNALEALGKYPRSRVRELAIRAWLYRITLNQTRTYVRRTSRRGESRIYEEEIPSGETRDTDGVIDALDALALLPEKQRVAVTLRYMQDLPYAEIAAATGWPENTVKTLVRRGLGKLREHMAVPDLTGRREEER